MTEKEFFNSIQIIKCDFPVCNNGYYKKPVIIAGKQHVFDEKCPYCKGAGKFYIGKKK